MGLVISIGPDDWPDVLSWNLRQASALWAAWAGGCATMRAAYESEDASADFRLSGSILFTFNEEDDKPKKPAHLQLVP